MCPAEILATITGLLSVWYTAKRNIWTWPTGLVMVFLYIFIFYNVKLYTDAGLQVIYVFAQIYGWYMWVYGGAGKTELPVNKLKIFHVKEENLVGYIFLAVVAASIWSTFVAGPLGSAYPLWDSLIVAGSLVAMWLQCRKVIQSWYFWIGVDVIAVAVYAARGLYLTTGLYAVFMAICVIGLLDWIKEYKRQEAATKAASPVVAGV